MLTSYQSQIQKSLQEVEVLQQQTNKIQTTQSRPSEI